MENNNNHINNNTFSKLKIIYGWRRSDKPEYIKIGHTELEDMNNYKDICQYSDNCDLFMEAANRRIKQQTCTASIKFTIQFASLAIKKNEKGKKESFTDKNFHKFLQRNGFQKNSPEKSDNGKNIGDEWFKISKNEIINYLNQYKQGKIEIINQTPKKIIFRKEQKEAINKTINVFKNQKFNKMLIYAVPRFGKTLVSYGIVHQIIEQIDKSIKKILIITHRPDLKENWYEDFWKYKNSDDNLKDWQFCSKNDDKGILRENIDQNKLYFYFASIQDLRGKDLETNEFKRNNKEVFDTKWDLIFIDEAHEGVTTSLFEEVDQKLEKKFSIFLSGTPFKLISKDEFKPDQIYEWTYIDEQRSKKEWIPTDDEDINPYEKLPSLQINVIQLEKSLKDGKKYLDKIEDSAFDFSIFFKTKNKKFVDENNIDQWLNNMCTNNENDSYNLNTMPFSLINRSYNNHSLWYVPGVEIAQSLEQKLKKHEYFKDYKIINAAGGTDDGAEILTRLKNIINDDNKTITLTCRRLTTGVTVKQWTTILVLANINSAQTYFQTIFRCKTPYTNSYGLDKVKGVIYDFAPTRIFEAYAEYSGISSFRNKEVEKEKKERINEVLNYLPLISFEGNYFKQLKSENLLDQVKKLYITNVVRNGFCNNDIFDNIKLKKYSLEEINNIQSNISYSPSSSNAYNDRIVVNKNNEGQILISTSEDGIIQENKIKKEKTDEQKKRERCIKNLKNSMYTILKRLPLMLLSLSSNAIDKITIENFSQHFDNESWAEFMTNVTVDGFKEIVSKCIDMDVLRGSIKKWLNEIDSAVECEDFEERKNRIIELFERIKNPSKETVLTPWWVIERHYQGININWKQEMEKNKGKIYILDLNSKSGLYPFYALWSLWIYFNREKNWKDIIREHIYVNCKTDVAVKITKRILGVRDEKYGSWVDKHIIKYDIQSKLMEYTNKK